MKKTTEQASHYHHLEQMSLTELLTSINGEDQKVPGVIQSCIPAIEKLVSCVVHQLSIGGRLFYLGAGTSGRLGIVDASECPPTFGVPFGMVVGLIAGGDGAIRKAVEFAEDDRDGGWNDLQEHEISKDDIVVGLTASGTTPYVVGALEKCRQAGIPTGCITCNEETPLEQHSDFPVVCVVGPEFVTGSTRMKAGTAEKLILNMITTATMVRLGRVEDNRMVDMQLSNNKLIDRGTQMVMEALQMEYEAANRMLTVYGSVRKAIAAGKNQGIRR